MRRICSGHNMREFIQKITETEEIGLKGHSRKLCRWPLQTWANENTFNLSNTIFS